MRSRESARVLYPRNLDLFAPARIKLDSTPLGQLEGDRVYEYDPVTNKRTNSDRFGFAPLSLIVFLALVPHSEDTHPVAGLDLEQCDIASSSEGNDEFSQERVVTGGLATGKRGKLQQLDCRFD